MPIDKWHVPVLLPYIYIRKRHKKKIKELSVNRALLGHSGQNMIQRTFCHDQNYKNTVHTDQPYN